MDKFIIIKGDIVRAKTEAIVNAANTSLLGGGKVSDAIFRYAGKQLLTDCEALNGCKTGEAKITKAYKLRCKHIIHTPGPIWCGGNKGEPELLAACYKNCLEVAVENDIVSLSFPSISTGIYKYPVDLAAQIAVREIMEFMKENNSIEEIYMICYDDENYNACKEQLKIYQNSHSK